MSYKNYIINSSKYVITEEIFKGIKTFDPLFNSLLLDIKNEKFDPSINASIKDNVIYLCPALFLDDILTKNKIDIRHIIAIIGHELGHCIHNHSSTNQSLQEEMEADEYSIIVLKRSRMNLNSMTEMLIMMLNNKNYIDEKIELRINNLNKFIQTIK